VENTGRKGVTRTWLKIDNADLMKEMKEVERYREDEYFNHFG
jgi:hypothetical protein